MSSEEIDRQRVVNQRKKVKSLSVAMLRWAEKNKKASIFEVSAMVVDEEWKKAFKYVTGLDIKLSTNNPAELTKDEMSKCNKYYSKYRWSEIII